MVKKSAAVALGRLGGKATSEAKTQAVRENAKLGGWPKRVARTWVLRGWAETGVAVGDRVRVHAKGFGHCCLADVEDFVDRLEDCRGDFAVVRLDRVGKTRAGWRAGQRTTLGVWWLEGEPTA